MRMIRLACKAFFQACPLPAAARVMQWSAARDRAWLEACVPRDAACTEIVDVLPGMLGAGAFDVAVCNQRLSQTDFFWSAFLDVARAVREGGWLLVVEPVGGPGLAGRDGWRMRADAGSALQRWAQQNAVSLALQESFVVPGLAADDGGYFVAVFRRSVQPGPAWLYRTFRRARCIRLPGADAPLRLARHPDSAGYFGARAAPGVVAAGAACNICGGTAFGPGPNGRAALNGRPPCCMDCGSLERQRIFRRVVQCLPLGFLGERRGLQFSEDNGVPSKLFRSYEVSVFNGTNSLDIQAIDRERSSYDFVAFSHVLEFVVDAKAAFAELARILGDDGVVFAGFSEYDKREFTIDHAQPAGPHGAWHLFGQDLATYFDCAALDLVPIAVRELDPCTGVREWVHLFVRRVRDAFDICEWVSAWSPYAEIRI